MEVTDSPVESVISHDIAVLQTSQGELDNKGCKDEFPNLSFCQHGHIEEDTTEDADRLENVHHVVLGLGNSALIQKEKELEIFECWDHHSCNEEEGEGIQDLFVFEGVADKLNI